MSRRIVFLVTVLLILIASSAIMVESAYAVPTKPSTPEFSLEVKSNQVDHPAIYKIDPYTGENVTVTPAYTDKWTSVVVTIKNQPFTSYTDSDGNQINLYYNVRSKGHFGDAWTERKYLSKGYVVQSSTDYTVRTYDVNYSLNAEIDFQVEAMIGYIEEWELYGLPDPSMRTFVGESSGWSSTQTITIGDGTVVTAQPTPYQTGTSTHFASESPTASAPQPSTKADVLFELHGWQVATIALSVVVVLLVFVMFYLRRRSVGRQ